MSNHIPGSPDYKKYRKMTRPYRRAFRGIISRREAERLFLTGVKAAAIKKLREQQEEA